MGLAEPTPETVVVMVDGTEMALEMALGGTLERVIQAREALVAEGLGAVWLAVERVAEASVYLAKGVLARLDHRLLQQHAANL